MNLSDELQIPADELAGRAWWQTVPVEWTPAQRQEFDRLCSAAEDSKESRKELVDKMDRLFSMPLPPRYEDGDDAA